MMRTIAILGGAGFIGSNYVRYVREHYPEYNIIVVDSLTYASNKEYLDGIDNIRFVEGNICDANLMNSIAEEADYIVNFAAETHVDNSIKDSTPFVESNIIGVHTILEAIRYHEVNKFIQISTDEVYGSITSGSFKEDDILSPQNPYSASKAAGELLCNVYYSTYNLPIIITRSSNNYGPCQHFEKFIPLIIKNAAEGMKIPVYGKGDNIRDWLYVEDNCCAIDGILHEGRRGETYNIGGMNELTNLKLVQVILDKLEKSEDLIEFVEDRAGHDKRYSLSIEKINKELGWLPKTDFATGIDKTIEWYNGFYKW